MDNYQMGPPVDSCETAPAGVTGICSQNTKKCVFGGPRGSSVEPRLVLIPVTHAD